MKKYVLLIIVILMTGCQATANFTIEKDKVTEEYIVSGTEDYEKIKQYASYPLPLYYDEDILDPYSKDTKKQEGIDYYDVVENNDEKKLTVKATFSQKNHVRSSVIRNCFKYYNITTGENNNLRTFSTSEGLTCDFKNFTINIKTPYKVIKNNADKVDKVNNAYTWNITSDKIPIAQIYFTIDFSKKYNEEENKNNNVEQIEENDIKENNQPKENKFLTEIIIILTILALITIILIFYFRNKKASEI